MSIPRAPVGPHVSANALRAALRDRAAGPSAEALRHAASCADCSVLQYEIETMEASTDLPPLELESAWERFGDRLRETAGAGPAPRVLPFPATARRLPGGLRLLLAAGLAAAVGSLLVVRVPEEVSEETRGAGRAATPSAVATVRPGGPGNGASGAAATVRPGSPGDGASGAAAEGEPEGELDVAPSAFLLPSGPGRIAVFDASHTYEWWSAPAERGPVAFPIEERRRLRPGVTYYWTAVSEESSRARAFRVRRATR